ncbi:hypothetical protein NIES3974_31520 [Calothrix sp. NIES-3974]|nr:hypothetical protein NIES3974_31520 [Calothrix sp. NIES-3974]
MTSAVLLRSGMTGNCHVPFWRAVEGATPLLTLIILNLARQARGGHPRSQAVGLVTATLLGESLLEQVAR